MERLTYREELGVSIDKNEDCPSCSICWNCNIPPRECKYISNALKKLADYEDLEEQGRLVKIPCKVGDTVWNYSCFGLRDYKVTYMGFDKDGLLYFDCESGIAYSFRCYLKDFKDKIFLTKVEAEEKLKELRGGENESSN